MTAVFSSASDTKFLKMIKWEEKKEENETKKKIICTRSARSVKTQSMPYDTGKKKKKIICYKKNK